MGGDEGGLFGLLWPKCLKGIDGILSVSGEAGKELESGLV